METPLGDAALAAKLVVHARKLYQDLTEELQRALRQLQSGEEDVNAKGRADVIRSHRKALQTVLDIELQFVKASKEDGGARNGLDLEAARREIYRRLDRISTEKDD